MVRHKFNEILPLQTSCVKTWFHLTITTTSQIYQKDQAAFVERQIDQARIYKPEAC